MFRATATKLRAPTPHEVHRRAALRMLRTLGLASRFALDDLHRAVEHQRGAPIHLVGWLMPPAGPSGLWISTSHAEYVFYPARASALARVVIIGHELAHIAYDDGANASDLAALAALLIPDVDRSVVRRPPGRTRYDADVERRAEVFGTVVAENVHTWSPSAATGDAALLQQLSATMEAVTVHG